LRLSDSQPEAQLVEMGLLPEASASVEVDVGHYEVPSASGTLGHFEPLYRIPQRVLDPMCVAGATTHAGDCTMVRNFAGYVFEYSRVGRLMSLNACRAKVMMNTSI
jgi:predicted aspartyl protease